MYAIGDIVSVDDRMQSGYRYEISAPPGADFAPDFQPYYTPKQMLELGVFEGKYCNDCRGELPADWYTDAKIADRPDPSPNCFGLKTRLVPMVLPILSGTAPTRDRRPPDQALARLRPPCRTDS
jgi:hypothetical protein